MSSAPRLSENGSAGRCDPASAHTLFHEPSAVTACRSWPLPTPRFVLAADRRRSRCVAADAATRQHRSSVARRTSAMSPRTDEAGGCRGLGVAPRSRWRYLRGISGDISRSTAASAVRLLLKAIRVLPEREQETVFAYLLERALVNEPGSGRPTPGSTDLLRTSIQPGFPGARMEMWSTMRWHRWGAALILRRLMDGLSVNELAAELGLDSDVLCAALSDLATRQYRSHRLVGIFGRLAEGKTIDRVADEIGSTREQVAAELEPSEALTSAVCAALAGRTALQVPASFHGSSPHRPLHMMPVRFPDQQYQRLKQWCEEHNFPMAVVVRGVVERFLEEQQRHAG